MNPFELFKRVYSMGLLIFSIIIVIGLIFQRDTKLSHDVHPVFALILMILCLIWLNMIEGGQGAIVGLPPVDRELYVDTHPKAHKCAILCHTGDNLDRYLVGRQFMVLAVIFVINLCGAPLKGSKVFGLPDVLLNIFLGSGIAMILMTTQCGQLNSQVNASRCMLDYVNNYFALFTCAVAMAIEFSGLLHSVYFFQIVFAALAGKALDSQEAPRTPLQKLFFWGRVVMSLAILGFAFAVTIAALFQGKTTMWSGVPNGVAVVLFFLFMCIVGLLEGTQIAFFAVAKLPKNERGDHPIARKQCQIIFENQGINLPRFMVGRQICVTLCFFIIARVTTLNSVTGAGENIFGVSDGLQNFFNTGLLGALITTILGSIIWQLIASLFPIHFLSNPLIYVLLRLCLLLEATGICAGAWVLAWVHKTVAHFQFDEVYIGTPEERAARKHADKTNEPKLHMGTNVLTFPPGAQTVGSTDWIDNLGPEKSFAQERSIILANIKTMQEQLKLVSSDEQRCVYETSLRLEFSSLKELNEKELESKEQNENSDTTAAIVHGDIEDA